MTDNLPTPEQCKEFTLLLGECWHEIKSEGYYDGIRQVEQPKCSCGKSFLFLSELKDHIARNNPTYSDAASILLKMKEKLGEIEFNNFMWGLNEKRRDHDCVRIIYVMPLKYIFNPAALIDKASEYLEKEGK
jgi:hypothetical protein